MIRRVLVLALLSFAPLLSQAQESLVGSYRLVSLTITLDGEPAPAMVNPHGYLIITPQLYLHAFTAENRKFGTTPEEKAALWDTLNFFGGPYRAEGNKITISVDTSFNQSWNGKPQIRTYKVDGKRLTFISPPMPNPRNQKQTLVATQIWERIE